MRLLERRPHENRERADMPEIINMGSIELKFLQSKESTGGSLDMFEMTVLPNTRLPVPHYHENWDETVYGLAGMTTWRIDGQDVTLQPGQTVFIPRGIVHGFSNNTQEPARCLCTLSPGVLGPAYFREMATLVAVQPPDLSKMKETMLRYGLIPVAPA